MASVLPLSLGAAVSPTMLTAIVLVLSGQVAPRERAWTTVAGATAAMLALTIAAPLVARALHSVNPIVIDRVDVIAGVLLLLLAVWNLTRKPNAADDAKKRAPSPASSGKRRLAEYFAFGIILIATDFSSTILYLAALKDIGYAHVAYALRLAVLVIPFFAVLAPAVVPAALASLAPRASDRALKPLAAWTGRHSKVITVAIAVVFGVYLLAKGLPPLFR
jgi:threonine/homoserine/homoserine lactone efflux protein